MAKSFTTSSETESFADTFTGAVHGGLDKVLGQSGTEAVLIHMKMTNNLPDPDEFHKKLLALFGAQATLSLERAIVKHLAIRLRWSLTLLMMGDSFDFSAATREMQRGVKA